MKLPEVPEDKRICPSCGAAVGRSRDGQPGRTEGFCAKCRNPFSFTPKLQPGDLVANQYEVAGCLAHGGLGWIYLARDKNVSNRWVVLKGLLNAGDADALQAAIVEQQFLAQVEHPLIVEIYNFVTHEDAGYIVMEYVGGTSLKQILKQRMKANNGQYDGLPVDQAIAYILEVLPAFQYLHDLGLVYCDFKPDNLIQVGDAVKLIDLGGVRRLDDDDSAIYGTVGYQAPEVARDGTTVASDIYTIGRTLVVLMMEFKGYQTKFVDKLPPVEDTPLFQRYDSLYRLLAKACAPDAADRFASIDELRVQLLGILREVVAEKTTGTALTSSASVLFEAPAITSAALEWDQLPELRVDTSDPQYAWLSSVSVDDPEERRIALEGCARHRRLRYGWLGPRSRLQQDQPELVDEFVNEMLAADPWEWRALWMSGLASLGARGLRRRAVGLQRRLRPGAGRARPQAGVGAGLRARRRGRHRPAALPDLREHRRQLPGSGGLRAGPDRRRSRRRGRCGGGARHGAADQPRLHRVPSAAGPAPVRVRRWSAGPVRCDEQLGRRTTRSRRAGRDHRADPGAGAGPGRRSGSRRRRSLDRPVPRRRRLLARRARGDLPRAGLGGTRPDEPASARRSGQRRTKVDCPMTCPNCGAEVAPHESFCEACGQTLTPTAAAAEAPTEESPITLSRSIRGALVTDAEAVVAAAATVRIVRWRGRRGRLLHDLRHEGTARARPLHRAPVRLGGGLVRPRHPAPPQRGRVGVASDPEPGSRAVLVVCDGVSSSVDSDVASLAAARAARDVLVAHQAAGLGVPASLASALAKGIENAAARCQCRRHRRDRAQATMTAA